MRLIVQRVSEASCKVDGKITGQIDQGFMVLVGLGLNDDEAVVKKMAEKFSKLRIFEDENGKINRSIYDVEGRVLSISVEEGIFGADMKIALVNDGPVTIILDSEVLW